MCILLYGDDIALLAMNIDKTKVLHIRPTRKARSSFPFACNGTIIEYCNECKYLEIWFNEYFDCKQILEHTAKSAWKALAGVCHVLKNLVAFFIRHIHCYINH